MAGKDRQEPDWEIDSCCEGAVAAQLGRVQKVEYMLSRIIRTCGLWPLVDVGGGGRWAHSRTIAEQGTMVRIPNKEEDVVMKAGRKLAGGRSESM